MLSYTPSPSPIAAVRNSGIACTVSVSSQSIAGYNRCPFNRVISRFTVME